MLFMIVPNIGTSYQTSLGRVIITQLIWVVNKTQRTSHIWITTIPRQFLKIFCVNKKTQKTYVLFVIPSLPKWSKHLGFGDIGTPLQKALKQQVFGGWNTDPHKVWLEDQGIRIYTKTYQKFSNPESLVGCYIPPHVDEVLPNRGEKVTPNFFGDLLFFICMGWNNSEGWHVQHNGLLLGGFSPTNPFETYAAVVNLDHDPPEGLGWKFQKIFELPPPTRWAPDAVINGVITPISRVK